MACIAARGHIERVSPCGPVQRVTSVERGNACASALAVGCIEEGGFRPSLKIAVYGEAGFDFGNIADEAFCITVVE